MTADPNIYRFAITRLENAISNANHSAEGSNVLEILKGFGNLTAISESNSKTFCELGLVNSLEKVLSDKKSSQLEIREALKCISMISGCDSCIEYIRKMQPILECMHFWKFSLFDNFSYFYKN